MQRHQRLGHGEINRRRGGREGRDQLERIEPVPGIDHAGLEALRLPRRAGAGIEVPLGIDHHQRASVVQNIGDHDPGGLAARRRRNDNHMAIATFGVHGDEPATALPPPGARRAGVEPWCAINGVGQFTKHNPAGMGKACRDLAGIGPAGLRQAFGFARARATPAARPPLRLCPVHKRKPRAHDHGDHGHQNEAHAEHHGHGLWRDAHLIPACQHEGLCLRPDIDRRHPEQTPALGVTVPGPHPEQSDAGQPEAPEKGRACAAKPGCNMDQERRGKTDQRKGKIIPGGRIETGAERLRIKDEEERRAHQDQHREEQGRGGQPVAHTPQKTGAPLRNSSHNVGPPAIRYVRPASA